MRARVLLPRGQPEIAFMILAIRPEGVLPRIVEVPGISPLNQGPDMDVLRLEEFAHVAIELPRDAGDMQVRISAVPALFGQVAPALEADRDILHLPWAQH